MSVSNDEEFLVNFFRKCQRISRFFVISENICDLGDFLSIFQNWQNPYKGITMLMEPRDAHQHTQSCLNVHKYVAVRQRSTTVW